MMAMRKLFVTSLKDGNERKRKKRKGKANNLAMISRHTEMC